VMRVNIYSIIGIGIVVLFYHFQENTSPKEQLDLVKKPTAQSFGDITKEE